MPPPTRNAPLSVQEMRLLSELTDDCKSPSVLADDAAIPRPTVYVLLRRLAERELVKGKPAPTDRSPGAVIYCITAKGRKVRAEFAKMLGLQP